MGAQLKVLEGVFQSAVIPEPEQIEELCKTTNLPAQEITKWFGKKLNEESKKRLLTNSTGSAGKNSPKGKESKSKVKVIETFKEMTKDQKRALEDIFKANRNPSVEMLTEISSNLLSHNEVELDCSTSSCLSPENGMNEGSDCHVASHEASINL